MSEPIALDPAQIEMLESVGKDLLRMTDLRATQVLAIVMLWRSLNGPPQSNVIELNSYSRRVS